MSYSAINHIQTVTIANGAAVSDAFDYGPYIAGGLITPAAWTAADIGFYVSDAEAGTYVLLEDVDDAVVKITGLTTNASNARPFPEELLGWQWVKLASLNTSTGAAENQGGARSIKLVMKA